MTLPSSLTDVLQSVIDAARPLLGQGKVADYIPALSRVNPRQLGIALCQLDGRVFYAGDAGQTFSIQSISKVFTLTQALQRYDDLLWQWIGREPSGQRFNSLIQLESEAGVPRNPFINAGALRVCDLLESRCSAPNFQLLCLLRELARNPGINVDTRIAQSEMQHSARNAAMAYLMQAYDNFDNPVERVLQSYAHHCAIEMSCIDLARAGVYLANQGRDQAGNTILSPNNCKRINALLATCGLYDAAGDFAFRVGLPGKSGVGGGILAIYPGHFAVCAWSPALNEFGNSLAATDALQRLSEALGVSVY